MVLTLSLSKGQVAIYFVNLMFGLVVHHCCFPHHCCWPGLWSRGMSSFYIFNQIFGWGSGRHLHFWALGSTSVLVLAQILVQQSWFVADPNLGWVSVLYWFWPKLWASVNLLLKWLMLTQARVRCSLAFLTQSKAEGQVCTGGPFHINMVKLTSWSESIPYYFCWPDLWLRFMYSFTMLNWF